MLQRLNENGEPYEYERRQPTGARGLLARLLRRVRDLLWLMRLMLSVWADRARKRRQLAQFNAHDMKDIGITAMDVAREINKPFWRP